MKISYNWLKQYVDFDWSPEELSDRLTMGGLEVEGLESFESIPGGLDGVVVGEVKTCEKHPNADKLRVTTVDIGEDELLPIVCGAPNVAAGQKVVVATVGTTLYPLEGNPFQIKKAKIRGERSVGMICAEDELGLGDDHDGIIVLPEDTAVGTPAYEIFDVEVDTILEIGLTPNRVDAASHLGTARDVAALLLSKVKWPETPAIEAATALENPFQIELPEPERCPRYAGIYIEGVEVKASPDWLKHRIQSIGLRPINNIVDITNFVLHELGQPLHAFDADLVRGQKIEVKTLAEDTAFFTLDDTERTIRAGVDLMICDAEGPIAVAGVMGGQNSEVSDQTRNVFLESAYFEPTGIRKTGSYLGLKTDASFRYERGIDPNLAHRAALRATALILELAGGKASVPNDVVKREFPHFEVQLDLAYAQRLIGSDLGTDTLVEILHALEIEVAERTETHLDLRVPPYRVDVQRPQDVLEDILRIYGYNKLPMPEQNAMSLNMAQFLNEYSLREKYFNGLAANGFNEILTCPLVPAHLARETTVTLANALTVDMAVLREDMLRTGLDTIEFNQRYGNFDLQLSEFGKTYHKNGESYVENEWIVLFLTGASEPAYWSGKQGKTKFYDLKREMERLVQLFGLKVTESEIEGDERFAYGLQLKRGDRTVARFGRVSNARMKDRDIRDDVFFAEIDWKELVRQFKKHKVKFEPLPKFPAISRDISMIVPDNVTYAAIRQAIINVNQRLIRSVSITDVYKGDSIGAGKKSYLITLTLLDEKKTLTIKAADKIMARIFSELESRFAVEIRK